MKINRFIYIRAVIISAFLLTTFISSCGDSRENEQSESAGTSQINLQITSGATGTFTTDENYVITLTEAKIDVGEVVISGSEGGGGHVHDHKSCFRHDEPSDEEEASCHFHGPFEFNLLRPLTDLGYVNTDPATYASLHFSYGGHEHEHDELTKDEEHHHGTVHLEGTAVKDGVEYPFHVVLEMEEEVERTGFSLELTRGHSGKIQIFYGVHHWFHGVDISQAPLEDGVYHINNDKAPELAAAIMQNARAHVRIDIPEDQ